MASSSKNNKTDQPCPVNVKLTKAKVVKYNINEPETIKLSTPEHTKEVERKVSNLRDRLTETSNNIALLRSWVGETIDVVKSKKPKSTKQVVGELKGLIIKIDEYEDLNEIIEKRGKECLDLVEELEHQSCYCALNSPSCEEIKGQLQTIIGEMDDLNAEIEKMQNGEAGSAGSEGFDTSEIVDTSGIVEEAKKELEQVVAACTIQTCVRKPKKASKQENKAFMETGMQANNFSPMKRPKLLQTDANPKWDEGTSPLCGCGGESKKKYC